MKTTQQHLDHFRTLDNPDLVAYVRENGSPTEGALAEAVWRLLSGNDTKVRSDVASQLYRQCGYEPFKGYPLVRESNVERLSDRSAVERIKNYLDTTADLDGIAALFSHCLSDKTVIVHRHDAADIESDGFKHGERIKRAYHTGGA